ncbi:hypothetical protein [Persicitalea jodogahamensis]
MDDELVWWSAELLKTEVQKHNRFDKVPQRIEFLKSRQPFFLRPRLLVFALILWSIWQYYDFYLRKISAGIVLNG